MPKQKKQTIDQLLAVAATTNKTGGQRPWHLIEADLRTLAKAKALNRPLPPLKTLSDFFFAEHGVRFSKTSIGEKINKFHDELVTNQRIKVVYKKN